MAEVISSGGSVGGRAASAKAESGYNQGTQFAAQGGYHGGVGQHMDLRSGNAAGSMPGAAPAASGYAQGDQFAASVGNGQGGHPVPGASHKDLRGGGAKSTYTQGNQFAAKKK
jgi:hypothetical protein